MNNSEEKLSPIPDNSPGAKGETPESSSEGEEKSTGVAEAKGDRRIEYIQVEEQVPALKQLAYHAASQMRHKGINQARQEVASNFIETNNRSSFLGRNTFADKVASLQRAYRAIQNSEDKCCAEQGVDYNQRDGQERLFTQDMNVNDLNLSGHVLKAIKQQMELSQGRGGR